MDLNAFHNLKSISWKGLRTEQDFASLAAAMQRNKDQLLELELDLFDWHSMAESLGIDEDEENNDSPPYFAQRVLGVHRVATAYGEAGQSWNYSLDFNERCESAAYVIALIEAIEAQQPAALKAIQYIEQPTHRDLAKHPENTMHDVAKNIKRPLRPGWPPIHPSTYHSTTCRTAALSDTDSEATLLLEKSAVGVDARLIHAKRSKPVRTHLSGSDCTIQASGPL